MAGARLNKIARELNVGISTLVDFLSTKGIEVETNPNTKVEGEAYDLLMAEFQGEKATKEKAEEAKNKREERIAVSLKQEEPTPIVKEEPAKKEEKQEVARVEVERPAGPRILHKIDLDNLSGKKKTAPVVQHEKSKTEENPKIEEKLPVVEEKVVAAKEEVKEEKIAIETIRVNAGKLAGTSVVGKIELPVEKAKKPGFERQSDADRKKRKRIKKVNIEAAGKTATKEFKKAKGAPVKKEVSSEEIQKEIKETLARLSGTGSKSKAAKLRKAKREAFAEKREEEMLQQELDKAILKVTEFVTVSELAAMMGKSPTEIIGLCMSIGIFASINQRLDAETLVLIAEEFGYKVEFVGAEVAETIHEEEDIEEDLIPRPPIVTVMGHVDHGKTSLLDNIRKTNVTAGEAGGITQHIGAYSVTLEGNRKITFLDTPGHEAFTAMRARGAKVTDIAIIIIAADDQIMPQTTEAINHAQAAGVPMIFAINKIDKPGANPEKIREQLAAMNILVEDWGGKFQCQEISAKNGIGIQDLLEKVLLESELLELKANPNRRAVGTIIESTLDKGRGFVTTLLVEKGTLKIGDVLIAGAEWGKVKAMTDERGERLQEAGPAAPVSILGMNGSVSAGDRFNVIEDEREAKQITTKRAQLQREQGLRTQRHITLDEIGRRLAIGDFKELNIIVKGDVDGSIEALSDSLLKLSTEQIQVNIIHKGVGQITESDVLLASASDAIIIGFQVRPSATARKLAENEQIDIRLYSVIYKVIEEIKDAMEGMLSPEIQEKITGTAEIREAFKITNVGTVAGCYVLEGKITRNSKVRIIRDGIVVYSGNLGSLKRFKDDVKEVTHGYECGLNIDKFNDIKVGDHVEAYEEVEVARKL
ncbi:MAG: translation initiation factor IF-2 [Flavobacteriales bacterium]